MAELEKKKLVWDKAEDRIYETGVSKGVLYVYNPNKDGGAGYEDGVAWNGLVSVTESPTGAEPNPLYADNIKYLNLMSVEELEATIEAFTYPDEFAACDGSAELIGGLKGVMIGQQKRNKFALCYQTKVGNELDDDLGFKLHIIYGAMASPSERAYETVNDSPEAITFSWEITTTPVEVEGFKPTAIITIDSTKLTSNPEKAALQTLLDKLYGVDEVAADSEATPPVVAVEASAPTLQFPDDIKEIFTGLGTEG